MLFFMLFMFCILYVFKILNKISSNITMAHIVIVQQCNYSFIWLVTYFLCCFFLFFSSNEQNKNQFIVKSTH